MLLYDTSEDYTFVFTPQFKPSQKEGVSTVTLSQQADDTRKTITYYDVYFTENTTAKVPINLTSTDYTMYIYEDGKVTTREPDEIYVDFKPTAKIISPENGSNFLAGENIVFRGMGTDPKEGELDNSLFSWTSNLHYGSIGVGKEFSTKNLLA